METFSVLARRAARGFAPLAALMTLGVGAVRVSADPNQAVATGGQATVQLASTAAVNNSVFRPFGTVSGVTAENALAKDASGNYTNPDAITAYKALTLYVAGALRYPVHRAQSGAETGNNDYYWESGDRYVGVENPGKLTAPIQVDQNGNLTDQGGTLTSLVAMYNQGDDHVKGIILAIISVSHDQVSFAAHRDLAPGTLDNGGVFGGRNDGLMDIELKAAQADTTNEKLNAIVSRISAAGLDPWVKPAPNSTVMDFAQGTTDSILDAARPVGGILAHFKRAIKGPQPQNLIAIRTVLATLIGVPYPPGAQVASIPTP